MKYKLITLVKDYTGEKETEVKLFESDYSISKGDIVDSKIINSVSISTEDDTILLHHIIFIPDYRYIEAHLNHIEIELDDVKLFEDRINVFIYKDYIYDMKARYNDACSKNIFLNLNNIFYHREAVHIDRHISDKDVILTNTLAKNNNFDYIECINDLILHSHSSYITFDRCDLLKETPLTKYVTKKYNIINSKELVGSLEEGVSYERDRF